MFRNLLFLLALACAPFCAAVDDYQLGPDSAPKADVPRGRVESFSFENSKIFPGTSRDCWVYIPAQYKKETPAALMVFQDGHAYVSTNGQMRVPIVFDNLIHAGEMPVTIALFVNPGHRGDGAPPGSGWGNRNNRSFEYDSLTNSYARFLIEELIPHITERFELKLTDEPELRAISGMSSGGICAFTAAWERPDYFRKVLSQIGSFTNIRGGHHYPALIRKTDRKPIRVFLQDGSNDLNNAHGNWFLGNLQMAQSLQFSGYDTKVVWGDGAHNGEHGGAILPDSLRWLWRHEAPRHAASRKQPDPSAASPLISAGQDWQLVGEGYGFTDAACAGPDGSFYFSDLPNGKLFKVSSSGKAEVWLENGPKISGMKFGPDGKLYAATQGPLNGGRDDRKKIISIDPQTKKMHDIATDLQPNDLVVSKKGWIFITDTGRGEVLQVPTSARGLSRPQTAAGGINKPNGIALSPDERWLYVSEYGGTNLWRFELSDEGRVMCGERMGALALSSGRADSGGDGMIADAAGRCLVTSHTGIQVFDATGKYEGTIPKPTDKASVSTALGGTDGEWLYACAGDKVFRRKISRGAGR